MRLRLTHRASAILCGLGFISLALAQDSEPLDEAFLMFLAEGMEVDGEWHDPMLLASMAELQDVPEDELTWISEQEIAQLENGPDESNDGEDDE
jgi:hypothetical protein